MKAIRYIIAAFGLVLLSVSCSTTRHCAFAPSETQLSLQMTDLEYLGETEVSVEYRRYLGFITVTDVINGEINNREVISRFPIHSSQELLPKLDRATYILKEMFPYADYFIVTSQTRERHQLFLGSQVKVTAKVKAYLLK